MSSRTQTWVVKIGSGLLTNKNGGVDIPQMGSFADQIARLHRAGVRVVLVSSGAVSAGMSALQLNKRPTHLPTLQACASIGQPILMRAYDRAFHRHRMSVAQILLTYWDLDSRKLYENTRSTLQHLLDLKSCVPIFNENDAISFEELAMLNKFGDNDRLSGHVAILARAQRLIILSSIDGLYTHPDGTGRLIRRVREIDDRIRGFAGTTNSERSVGGMISKLETGRMMLEAGIPMWIANGREKDVLWKIHQKKPVGTHFQRTKRTT